MKTSEILQKMRAIAVGDYFPNKIFGALDNNKGELQEHEEDRHYKPQIEDSITPFSKHYGPGGKGEFNIVRDFGSETDSIQQRMAMPDDEIYKFAHECDAIGKIFEEKMRSCSTSEDYEELLEIYKLWNERTKRFSEGKLSDLKKDLEHILQVGLQEARRELDERRKAEQAALGTSRT